MSTQLDTATVLLSNAVAAARASAVGIGNSSAVVPGYGRATVSYSRVTRTYDVGTDATSWATGRRGAVLPVLVAILSRAA